MLEKLNLNSEEIIDLVLKHGTNVLLAILVLVLGLIAIRWITRGLVRMMKKANVNESLIPFLRSITSIILKVLLFISILSMVGIEMVSFVAILGAAGLAVGLALQGTLQNFAGGVMILLFKPYKVGDYIEAQGFAGSVKEIQIFNTILATPDNSKIVIPNSPLATQALRNYTAEPTRRIDFSFGIGYGDDIDKAKAVLMKLATTDERVLKDPEPMVAVEALADSSVNLKLRVWVNSGDYWSLFFDMTELVKKTFDKEGISIPFPQHDVHMVKS
jgi:small conductance mechanosensitive channel